MFTGTLLLCSSLSEDNDALWTLSSDSFPFQKQLMETQVYLFTREQVKVGANTWSIEHEFFKLFWIVNIHQKAKACSCRLYRVTTQKVTQILSQNRGKN